MYQPREFRGADAAAALDHIARHPFGLLISGGRLSATHLPFLVEAEPVTLVSHLAGRNPQWRAIDDGDEVLCVFPGPNAYVTADAYVAEPDVPTWNYTAVHARGRYRRIHGDAAIRALLAKTVATFERGRRRPWDSSRVPPADYTALARRIVGFQVEITEIESGYKLSQDKTQADVDAVLAELGRGDAQARAVRDEMRRHGVRGRTGSASTAPEL